MSDRKAVLGSDHAAVGLRRLLSDRLAAAGYEVVDLGLAEGESVDYPDQAEAVASAVGRGEADLGVLACGTGIGMSIAANKVQGVRAALVHDPFSARMARAHNAANVICFGARVTGEELALASLDAFLDASVDEAQRHSRRRGKLASLEREA